MIGGPPRAVPTLFVWHLLAALLLIVVPSQIWLGEPVWQGNANGLLQAIGLATVYAIATVSLPRAGPGQPRRSLLGTLTSAIAPLAAYYLVLLVLAPYYSRGVLLIGSTLLGLLVVVPSRLPRRLGSATAAVGCSLVVVMILGIRADGAIEPAAPGDGGATQTEIIITNRQVLKATHLPSVGDTIWGGGLGRLGEDMLLVTGGGEFWRIRLSGGQFVPEPIDLHAPLHREDFVAATDTTVLQERFRVSGLWVQPVAEGVRLVVSHHHWKVGEGCFVLRLSETIVDEAQLAGRVTEQDDGAAPIWRTLYDTRPCLGIKDRGDPFAGQQSGGRVAALGDSALILTVGDNQFDGVNSGSPLPQSLDNDYGKTLVIPRDGPPTVFTIGHRNPQGLLVASTGEIWLTEHGPEGGDELNLLVDGANYGWPFHTYGTQYDDLTWPLTYEPGAHTEFSDPHFVWVPSIGVSNLIAIEADVFPQWKGDLLVASLGAQSLYRLHRERGRFVYAEPIYLGLRVRDLAESADGRLVLWSDEGGLSILTPADKEEERRERERRAQRR